MTTAKLILERLLALALLAFWAVPLYTSNGDALSPWTLSLQHPVIWLGVGFPLAFLWATWIQWYRLRLVAILALALFVDAVLTFVDGERFMFELGIWLVLIVLVCALATTFEDGLSTAWPNELRHAVPFVALGLALAVLAPVYMSFESQQKVRNSVYLALVGPSARAPGSIDRWVAPSPASRAPATDANALSHGEPASETGGTATLIFALVSLAIAVAATGPLVAEAQSLHEAVRQRNLAAVRTSLMNGADADAVDRSDGTALHMAVAGGMPQMAAVLVESGADVTAQDPDGRTPLSLAVHGTSAALVRLLLAKGSAVRVADREGKTPLHHAAEARSTVNVALLLDAGAAIDARAKDGSTPLHLAALSKSHDVVALLLDRGADIEAPGQYGYTALHDAVWAKAFAVIELLLARGAVVDARNELGVTPLAMAALAEHREAIELLLDRGAAIDARDTLGRTPLMRTVAENKPSAAKLLIERGADPNLRDSAGYTPQQIAAALGNTALVELLRTRAETGAPP